MSCNCEKPDCAIPYGLCHCGCGQNTKPYRGKYANYLLGTPRVYVIGHHQRGKKRPEHSAFMYKWMAEHPEHTEKLIAAGHLASIKCKRTPEQVERWKALRIAHGNWAPTGAKHPNWKGGVRIIDGYVYLYRPGHPLANACKYVKRSRLVLEEHLRESAPDSIYLAPHDGVLYLRKAAEAHHFNEVKDDDRIENLQPLWKREHSRLHGKDRLHILSPNNPRIHKHST